MKANEFPQFSREILSIAEEAKKRIGTPWKEREHATIYFAHALTQAPESALAEAQRIKDATTRVEQPGSIEIDTFFGLGPANNSENIVAIDIPKAIGADLLVGVHLHPSYGAGGEVHLRAFLGLPTLFLVEKGKRVSRMMSDISNYGDHCAVAEYDSPQSAVEVICAALSE